MSVSNLCVDCDLYTLKNLSPEDKYTIEDGKAQLARYLDHLGLDQGYLVVFDPGDKEWEEKLYYRTTDYNGKVLVLVGL